MSTASAPTTADKPAESAMPPGIAAALAGAAAPAATANAVHAGDGVTVGPTSEPATNVPAVVQQAAAPAVSADLHRLDQSTLDRILNASRANLVSGELQFSRLGMMQPQSPEITREVAGFKQGMFFDNRTKQIYSEYGPMPWLLAKGIPAGEIPSVNWMLAFVIGKLPNEYINWKDRSTEGMGWWFKTLDANDPLVRKGAFPPAGKWGTKPDQKGIAPPITDNTNFLILPGLVDIVNGQFANPRLTSNTSLVATFAKTSKDAGKAVATSVEIFSSMTNRPYWCRPVFLYTKRVEKGQNTWWEANVADGPIIDALGPAFKALIDSYSLPMASAMSNEVLAPSDGEKPITKGREFQEMILSSAKQEGEDEEEDDGVSFDEAIRARTGRGPASGTPADPTKQKSDIPF